jgi:hypothetical protein
MALLGDGAIGDVDEASVAEASEDDLHLSLYLAYELHYGGIDGVDPDREWSPAVLAFRGACERRFEADLRAEVGVPDRDAEADGTPIDRALRQVLRDAGASSFAEYLAERASVERFREFLIHRSAYHLKEADPFTGAIPRLDGAAKAAMVQIQADEYGGGDPAWMHSALFANTMRAFGLDPEEGAPLELLPGTTLATVNLISMFGLHRRLRGALVGHLAAFEMSSCIPNRRYGDGARRLGFDEEATRFFDEHVEADAVHEAVAANDLAGSLVAAAPELRPDVLFGARALLHVEGVASDRILAAWEGGRSSLRAGSDAVAV